MAEVAATYLRVSSDKQTVANQVPDVERLCAARGFVVARRYEETESAYKRQSARPEFQRMLTDAKRGWFSVLIIWAIDRFGRTMVNNLLDCKMLWEVGVTIVSVKESWLEQPGPIRDLLVAVFSWMAEQESKRRGERVRAALERVALEGTRSGRRIGRPPAHLDADGEARWTPEEVQSLLASGLSQGAVARRLHTSKRTVQRVRLGLWRGAQNPSSQLCLQLRVTTGPPHLAAVGAQGLASAPPKEEKS